ncbi:MAG: helix-turn-helix transcriptional regulator [Ferrovum myxofaciens]|nr:helix-turn-helix transcriptional regulator [Ferrovum myxofaciens]
MSQQGLATAAKCSRPTINRIESLDKASPRSDTVDELLQVFRDKGGRDPDR